MAEEKKKHDSDKEKEPSVVGKVVGGVVGVFRNILAAALKLASIICMGVHASAAANRLDDYSRKLQGDIRDTLQNPSPQKNAPEEVSVDQLENTYGDKQEQRNPAPKINVEPEIPEYNPLEEKLKQELEAQGLEIKHLMVNLDKKTGDYQCEIIDGNGNCYKAEVSSAGQLKHLSPTCKIIEATEERVRLYAKAYDLSSQNANSIEGREKKMEAILNALEEDRYQVKCVPLEGHTNMIIHDTQDNVYQNIIIANNGMARLEHCFQEPQKMAPEAAAKFELAISKAFADIKMTSLEENLYEVKIELMFDDNKETYKIKAKDNRSQEEQEIEIKKDENGLYKVELARDQEENELCERVVKAMKKCEMIEKTDEEKQEQQKNSEMPVLLKSKAKTLDKELKEKTKGMELGQEISFTLEGIDYKIVQTEPNSVTMTAKSRDSSAQEVTTISSMDAIKSGDAANQMVNRVAEALEAGQKEVSDAKRDVSDRPESVNDRTYERARDNVNTDSVSNEISDNDRYEAARNDNEIDQELGM